MSDREAFSSHANESLSRGGLAGLSIRRPVTMLMLFIALLVVGLVAWKNIPIQMLPSGLTPSFLWIWMVYPDSSPTENLERIGIPVEEEFSTIKGLKQLRLRARANGCGVFVEFKQSVDMSLAYLEVRDRLERVRPRLPDDFRYAYVRRFSENDEPVLYMGVTVQGGYEDPYGLIRDEVVRPLERIDGVAAVEVWGGDEKGVRIELLLERLKAYNLAVPQLMQALRDADFSIGGGEVNDAGRRLLVRVDGRLRSIEEIKRLPVKGTNVMLGDIADITYSRPTATWVQRIDQDEAVQIGVMKQAEANAVDVSKRLHEVVQSIAENPRLSGVKFNLLFDQGRVIQESINNLGEAGLWGAFFAVAVLYLFLRRLRMTVFITAAIPLSLLATLICLFFMGWSLNIITLSGLMISVGMVVDNAIVVVESIDVHKRRGASPKSAALGGTSEVALAITMATLTTMVVFLPLMLMSGDRILSFYLMRIGMPIILALMASLFVALLLIPLAVSKFAMRGAERPGALVDKGERLIGEWTRKVLDNRSNSVFIIALLLASTALPISKVVSTDSEEGHINDFTLRFRFPAYFDMAAIDTTMQRLEGMLYANAERYDLKTVVTGFRSGFARVRVFLNDAPEKPWFLQGADRLLYALRLKQRLSLERKDVIKDIKENFPLPADVELFTSWQRGGGDEAAITISVYGEDTNTLMQLAQDIQKRLELIPKVVSVEQDIEAVSEEVLIQYDRQRTGRYGVDPRSASIGLMSLLRGVELERIRFAGRETVMRVELRESDRQTLSQVMNFPAWGASGDAVRIDDVAEVNHARGLGEISRENQRTRVSLKIVTAEENIEEIGREIDGAMAGIKLPFGYEWGKGQRFADIEDAARQRNQAWMLAIVFVLLLMGALFESFLLPFAVIATVPLSFFGVWWSLYLTGTQFGIMAAVGVVVLIGVVVNNAIVLVDKANKLRLEGFARDEALAMASRIRFRPIAMTALTTIMGLLPMAVGQAGMIGIPYSPMGRVMIGGMIAATLSTPLVVPLAYSILDDFQIWLKSLRANSIDSEVKLK